MKTLFVVSDLKRLVTFEDSFGSLHHQEHLFGLLPYYIQQMPVTIYPAHHQI